MSPVLEAHDVTMRFGGVAALREVSLALQPASVMGLLGQNGAGKSTLMKILSGQQPAGTFEGTLSVGGAQVRLRSPQEATRLGIGLVPQETSIVPSLTVAENILLGQYGMRFITQRRMFRAAQQFLSDMQISLDADRLVATISSSERQLVMIARTLYAKPSILILDEPTTALTDSEVERLHGIVRDLRGRGVSTVLISHRLDEVFSLADHITVFRDGRNVFETTRDHFDRSEVVRQIAGRDIVEVFPKRREGSHVQRDVVLAVQGLTVPDARARHRPVVDAVDLTVRAGEIVGLGGALGAGRTEILEALFGVRPTSKGSVLLNQRPLAGGPGRRIAAGVGFVPEDRKAEGLFFNGSVSDNLALPSLPYLQRLRFVRRGARRRLVQDQIAKHTIRTSSASASIGTLSGGNQQKVLIARALARKPGLILLDEPTKGVDVGAKFDIYMLIRQAADEGAAVLIVSSEATELIGLCDRVLVLYRGKITHETIAQDVSEEDLLAASMSGRLTELDSA